MTKRMLAKRALLEGEEFEFPELDERYSLRPDNTR